MAINIFKYANNWAYDIDKDVSTYGEITDVDVINQSIEMILTTLRGERLFNLTFGSDFKLRIFDSMNEEFLERLIDDTVDAIRKWETRITIIEDKVKLVIRPDNNSAFIFIPYIINERNIKAEFKKKITA